MDRHPVSVNIQVCVSLRKGSVMKADLTDLQGKILHQERDGRDKDVLKTRPQHRVRTQEFNGPTVW